MKQQQRLRVVPDRKLFLTKEHFVMIGNCRNCNLVGVLAMKPFLAATREFVPNEEITADMPVVPLCVTCDKTPAGFPSENLKL